ncbi:MAG: ATP synthase F1 subunit gamma, partial [Gammaproteobacteria bacterium]
MAGSKEIRTQVASIKGTQKITKAMEMVAASKMRKAQERMLATRPYAEKIQNVVEHLSQAHPEYHHPYLQMREPKRVGLIIISTDRGLCGGLNINLFKSAITSMKEWDAAGLEIDLTLIGTKSGAFFKRLGGNIVATATHLGDTPSIVELIGTVKVMLDAYEAGTIDRLYLAHNEFENTMTQNPLLKQLIPVAAEPDEQLKDHWDYIYEPDSRPVMDALMIRYIESLVYQG